MPKVDASKHSHYKEIEFGKYWNLIKNNNKAKFPNCLFWKRNQKISKLNFLGLLNRTNIQMENINFVDLSRIAIRMRIILVNNFLPVPATTHVIGSICVHIAWMQLILGLFLKCENIGMFIYLSLLCYCSAQCMPLHGDNRIIAIWFENFNYYCFI